MPPGASKYLNMGRITSNITTDANNYARFSSTYYHLIVNPCLIIAYTIILFTMLKWIALLSPILIVLMTLVQNGINQRMYKELFQKSKVADVRGKTIEEMIKGIKMIKFNTWEPYIIKKIRSSRIVEKTITKKIFFLNGLVDASTSFIPVIVGFLSFYLYNLFYQKLSIPEVYAVISIYNNLGTPIRMVMFSLISYT
jgi:ABC-type multidrug transport system fused ATPase/permease subunit